MDVDIKDESLASLGRLLQDGPLKGTPGWILHLRGATCNSAVAIAGSDVTALLQQHALFLMHVGAPRVAHVLNNLSLYATADHELMQQLWLGFWKHSWGNLTSSLQVALAKPLVALLHKDWQARSQF